MPGTPERSAPRATDDFDEFSFLPVQAQEQGLPAPAVRRLRLSLPDGRSLAAVAYGAERPRIVLLHGAGLNAHTWDNTAIALGEAALAVDLPGHGSSSWREDADYAPRLLAADVAAAIQAWAQSPVVLVGQSLGGLTAAAVAAARPDLVSETVLVDVVPGATAGASAELGRFYEETVFESRDALLDRALAFGLGGSIEQARRGVWLNSRVREDGRVEWRHHIARLLSPGGPGILSSFSADDGWEDLVALRSPLTLVRAADGHVSEEDAAGFAARIPGARLVTLAGPHNVQEVAFADLAALIASKGNAHA